MYKIRQAKSFTKDLKKLVKQKRISIEKINSIIYKLAQDPFAQSLNTHKVNTKALRVKYSSRVDGDLRMIWDFDEHENLVILLFDIGGHSGSRGIY